MLIENNLTKLYFEGLLSIFLFQTVEWFLPERVPLVGSRESVKMFYFDACKFVKVSPPA